MAADWLIESQSQVAFLSFCVFKFNICRALESFLLFRGIPWPVTEFDGSFLGLATENNSSLIVSVKRKRSGSTVFRFISVGDFRVTCGVS